MTSDYAFGDYGVVLNGLGTGSGRKEGFDDEWLEEMAEGEVIAHQFSFTGEAFPLTDEGNPKWSDSELFSDESVYYIAIKHHPGLFDMAYRDMDQLIDELEDSYRQARKHDRRLPKLSRNEIRARVRKITGTYYG